MRRFLLVLPLLLTVAPARATVLHVRSNAPGPAHDGASWTTAFLTVSAGLQAAASGDQVWVAAGTYVERISLKSGVALYGGFAGTETALAERNVPANITILDGNSQGSVVRAASLGDTAVVDGFTIRNGSGTFVIDYDGHGPYGGGIYCTDSKVAIANNVITGNLLNPGCSHCASYGDGIACFGGEATITGNTITGNGGSASSLPSVAAGIYCQGCKATITGNRIVGNSSKSSVGCGINLYYATAAVSNNLIAGNWGGGIWTSQSTATLFNNTIAGNSATGFPIPQPPHGIGVYVDSGTVSMVNNIVAYNSSGVYGTSTTLTTVLNNDVFGNNTTGTPDNYAGMPDPTGTGGNIGADPLFADRTNGDYHLMPGSPSMDAGEDFVVTAGETDLDGKPRISGAHVDLGAYEAIHPDAARVQDAQKALRIAAGLDAATDTDKTRLNVEAAGPSATVIDMADAIRLLRKAWTLDP